MSALLQVLSRITVRDDNGLVLLIVLVGAICLGISVYLVWYCQRWVRARGWVKTCGRIVSMKENIDRRGSGAPKVDIVYEYTLGGKIHRGRRLGLGYLRDRPDFETVVELRNRLSSGDLIDVFVDPQNPDRSSASLEI